MCYRMNLGEKQLLPNSPLYIHSYNNIQQFMQTYMLASRQTYLGLYLLALFLACADVCGILHRGLHVVLYLAINIAFVLSRAFRKRCYSTSDPERKGRISGERKTRKDYYIL